MEDVVDAGGVPYLKAAQAPLWRVLTERNSKVKDPAARRKLRTSGGGGALSGAESEGALGLSATSGVDSSGPGGAARPKRKAGAKKRVVKKKKVASASPLGDSGDGGVIAGDAGLDNASGSGSGAGGDAELLSNSASLRSAATRPREPLTFDVRAHPSWVQEKRDWNVRAGVGAGGGLGGSAGPREALEEFLTIDKTTCLPVYDGRGNKKSGPGRRIGDGQGFIDNVTYRYTRALGLVLIVAIEKGYLGDDYLYVIQVPKQRNTSKYLLQFRDMVAKGKEAKKKAKGKAKAKAAPPAAAGPSAAVAAAGAPAEGADAASTEAAFDPVGYWGEPRLLREGTGKPGAFDFVEVSTDGGMILATDRESLYMYAPCCFVESEQKDKNVFCMAFSSYSGARSARIWARRLC